MARSQTALRQTLNEPEYDYGGDGLFGFLMPYRREVISPAQNLPQGYTSTGRGIGVESIPVPAKYGEAEKSVFYSPAYRGLKSALHWLNDLGNDPKGTLQGVAESVPEVAQGIDQYARDQYRAAALGGRMYDPETGQVTEFDPTIAMAGGAPAGVQAVRAATPGSVVLGSAGGKIDRGLDMSTSARMQRAAEGDWNPDRPVYHWTEAPDIEEFIPSTRGKLGAGVYASPIPSYGERYVDPSKAIAMPLNYRGKLAGIQDFDDAWNVARSEMPNLTGGEAVQAWKARANDVLAERGFTGREVDDEVLIFDPKNIRSTSAAFDPAQRGSSNILASGSKQGTGIALGSALTGDYTINPYLMGFDPSYEGRAKQIPKTDVDFRYLGSAPEIPEVSIFDFEGRPFVTSMSDRSMGGPSLAGIGGTQFDLPVDLLGGQNYMFGNPGELWAAAQGPAGKIQEAAMYAGALGGKGNIPLYIPYRMGATGSDFSHMTTDTMLTFARNNMTKGGIKKADKAIKSVFPDFKGIENPDSMRQLSEQSDSVRGRVRQIMDRDFKDDGGISIGMARLAISDPGQYTAMTGGIQNVGEFDLSSPIFRSSHPSYPYAIPGQGLGRLKETDINIYELMPRLSRLRGIDVTKPIPQAEMYTLQTGIKGAPGQLHPEGKALPFSGVITEDILRAVEARRK